MDSASKTKAKQPAEALSQQDVDAEVQKALAAVCGGGLEFQTCFSPKTFLD